MIRAARQVRRRVTRSLDGTMQHDFRIQIGDLFGRCIVRAGFQERDEEPAVCVAKHFGQIAKKVHAQERVP